MKLSQKFLNKWNNACFWRKFVTNNWKNDPFYVLFKNYTILHLNDYKITDLAVKEAYYVEQYIWVDRGEGDEEDDMKIIEYNYFFVEKLKDKETIEEVKLYLLIGHFFDEFNSS